MRKGQYVYDWNEIQRYHDKGYTWREVQDKYGCCLSSLAKARKRGDLITRCRSEAGKIAAVKHPRKHTKETKKKISKIRRKYLESHPEKVPYRLNHYTQGSSYPERYFRRVFKNEGLDFTEQYQISLYQLDFADVERKIDIEIDGDQHYLDMRIAEGDKRRNAFLQSQGWTVYRIRWSDYKKMSLLDRKKVVNEIRQLIRLLSSIG